MSFLLRLFQKAEEDDETVLSALALDIQKRQTKLDEIRLRERRTTLAVSVWSLFAWSIYSAIWYAGWSGSSRTQNRGQRAIRAAPVVVGPIFILFVRRIVQLWFSRKGNAEEATLRGLRKKQHTKVEQIKKKTNYYSTRDLLAKYDQATPSNSPLKTPPRAPATQQPPQQVSQQRQPQQATPQQGVSASPAVPPPAGPAKRYWYDRLADVVLGEEPNSPNPTAQQYALICEKCFSHNGLVKESVWQDTQYVCPKCGFFNKSKRSKRTSTLLSPTSPQFPSSPNASPTPSKLLPTSPSPSPLRSEIRDKEVEKADTAMEVDS